MAATNENASLGGAGVRDRIALCLPSREPLETTHRAKLTAQTEQHRQRHYAQQGRRLPCPRAVSPSTLCLRTDTT